MISTLNLFPEEFKNRSLLQIVASVLDKHTSVTKNKVITSTKVEDIEFINFEYITAVNAVYTDSIIYIEDIDYTIELKDDRSIISWIGDKPEDDSNYYLDIDYYTTCSGVDYEISEPLLFELLHNYNDKSAALAYFKTMILPSLGTLYCIDNMIKMIQLDADIEEWFTTDTLRPFLFNINLVTIPELININTFIDYVLLLKNERSHLARVGQNVCGTANVWDYFIYDDGLWDDDGGITYKGTKVCLVEKIEETLFYDLPASISDFHWFDGQYFIYSPTLNYWCGNWKGDWDKLEEIQATNDFYYSFLANGNMELDSNWYNANVYNSTLKPFPGLKPGNLKPSQSLGAIVTNERSDTQVFEGNYSRRFVVTLFEGIRSEQFTTSLSKLNFNFRCYSSNSEKIQVLIKDTVSGLPINVFNYTVSTLEWILIGQTFDLDPGTYELIIVNFDFTDDYTDSTNYEIFIDDLIIREL